MKEHFDNLGANPVSTNKELKDAWRKKCLEHHPDKGGDAEMFKKVMHSYKMITDPSYQYEEKKKEQSEGQALAVNIQTPVDFNTAFFGRPITISYNRVVLDKLTKQPIKQEIEEFITITVDLPSGAVFQGYQHINKTGGFRCEDEVGEAIVTFMASPHPRFRPEGINIIAQEKLPLSVMLSGGKIEVETMYGIKTALVPPASKPGDRIIIKRCGIMEKGDHIIILDPIYPDKDGLKKGEWKGLKINWELMEEDKHDAKMDELYNKLGGRGGFTIRFK